LVGLDWLESLAAETPQRPPPRPPHEARGLAIAVGIAAGSALLLPVQRVLVGPSVPLLQVQHLIHHRRASVTG